MLSSEAARLRGRGWEEAEARTDRFHRDSVESVSLSGGAGAEDPGELPQCDGLLCG